MSVATRRPPRAVLAEHAQALRELGKTGREIGDLLGVSRAYASQLYTDPDGSKDKARKATYAGACIDCSAPTNGNNGHAKAPRRCALCQVAFQRTEEYKTSIQVWTRELFIARIQEWTALYGRPPAIVDWNPWQARHKLNDEARARRWEDADGHWPWFTLVVSRFGSWNAALAAAGFEPRPPHGTSQSAARRRPRRRAAA